MADKRITDQVTDTTLSAGDYIIVDSSGEGTRKFDLGTKLSAIDTAITAEATAREAADSQLKEDLDQVIQLPGENIVALTDFIASSTTTVSVDETDDSITVSSTSNGTYRASQTSATFIQDNLTVGENYRLHVKATKISGNPNIHVNVRGIEGNQDGTAATIILNDGGEGFVDFVVDEYMKRIALFITWNTSASASVKFSDIWLKKYDITGIDEVARTEINALNTELDSISNSVDASKIIVELSGNPINVKNAANVDAEGIEVSFLPTQSGSGTPSKDNVRSITGHTGVTLDVADAEYNITFSEVYGGTAKYMGKGEWSIEQNVVLATIPYSYFRGLAVNTYCGVDSNGYVWIRNFAYNTGNGIVYPNKVRRNGGYYCISNVFEVANFNNSLANSSQNRLYIKHPEGVSTWSDFLDVVTALESNNIPIVFAYAPTVETPKYTFSTEAIMLPSGDSVVSADVGTISIEYLEYVKGYIDSYFSDKKNVVIPSTKVRSVNHRGWHTYPENTLSAFKQSKIQGFDYVETDVRFTSDNVAVLLHDTTINRTARNSDGTAISETINISDITYAEALTYDFGVYKGEEFAGEKIPTLEEFLELCRNIDLIPLTELQSGTTDEKIEIIANIVKKSGIRNSVVFTSNYTSLLEKMIGYFPDNRFGVCPWTYSDDYRLFAISLFNNKAQIYIGINYTQVTPAIIQSLADSNIPLDIWVVDATAIRNADGYVSGFVSNDAVASDVLYNSEIS